MMDDEDYDVARLSAEDIDLIRALETEISTRNDKPVI